MIVVVIIGILAAIALPNYRQYVIRSNRTAAQAQMLEIANRQQQFLLANRSYADTAALSASGFTLSGEVSPHYSFAVTVGSGTAPRSSSRLPLSAARPSTVTSPSTTKASRRLRTSGEHGVFRKPPPGRCEFDRGAGHPGDPAVGLLGVMALQARLQQSEMETYQRSQALLLLDDLAARMTANRTAAASYVTGTSSPLGAGMACPTSSTTQQQRDAAAWCAALQGTRESTSGVLAGGLIGGRGCVEALGNNQYLLTVAWQGLLPRRHRPASLVARTPSTETPAVSAAATAAAELSPRWCGWHRYETVFAMRGYSASAGFGLIELMVAMTLALILSAATLTLYLNMSRSNSELAKTNSQMEHGRLAIRLLRDDLMHAGFLDGYLPEFDDLTATAAPADYPSLSRHPVRPIRLGTRRTRPTCSASRCSSMPPYRPTAPA